MTKYLYPYKMGSRSGKVLAMELGIKRIRTTSTFRFKSIDTVINWGNSEIPSWGYRTSWLNHPMLIGPTVHKLKFFRAMKTNNVNVVPFTTDKGEAESWLANHHVVCRHVLTGKAGQGIEVVNRGATELPRAPVYTQYKKPRLGEFRVHVFNDKVIDIAQKKRTYDVPDEEVNWKIRSHTNGWIFARNDIEIPSGVREEALKAITGCALDFGAVDLLHDNDKVYILEVNTAPGLEGTTLQRYSQAIAEYLHET